jgi:hypothetical protein
MTKNQIDYRKELEQERTNLENERLKGVEADIKNRTLDETIRDNLISEANARLNAEASMANARARQATADVKASELAETIRANSVKESWYPYQYGTDATKTYFFVKDEVLPAVGSYAAPAVQKASDKIDSNPKLKDWATGYADLVTPWGSSFFN